MKGRTHAERQVALTSGISLSALSESMAKLGAVLHPCRQAVDSLSATLERRSPAWWSRFAAELHRRTRLRFA